MLIDHYSKHGAFRNKNKIETKVTLCPLNVETFGIFRIFVTNLAH